MLPGILARHVDVELVMGVLDHGNAQALFLQLRDRPRQQGGLAGAAPSREAYYFHFMLRHRRYNPSGPGKSAKRVFTLDVPGIHVSNRLRKKTWMAGTSPAMTGRRDLFTPVLISAPGQSHANLRK